MIDNHDLGYMVSHSNPAALLSFAYLPFVASFSGEAYCPAAFVRDAEREERKREGERGTKREIGDRKRAERRENLEKRVGWH